MMTIQGFTKKDFDVFTIDGLDERMEAIKSTVRPKLEAAGEYFAPAISSMTGDEMFYHVAKHARRKVNPPDDTWVAFADNKRGYKKLPHFQIGLFESHLFVWFAVIYESPIKGALADQLFQKEEILHNIPDHYVWSMDHTKPDAELQKNLSAQDRLTMIDRLKSVKKSELLCGIHLNRDDERVQDGEKLTQVIEETFETVLPLYRTAKEVHANS